VSKERIREQIDGSTLEKAEQGLGECAVGGRLVGGPKRGLSFSSGTLVYDPQSFLAERA
jgi:hypothetical protein